MKIVYVVWNDALSVGGNWQTIPADVALPIIDSAGLLTKEAESFIMLSVARDRKTGDTNNSMLIPRKCIISMELLKEIATEETSG